MRVPGARSWRASGTSEKHQVARSGPSTSSPSPITSRLRSDLHLPGPHDSLRRLDTMYSTYCKSARCMRCAPRCLLCLLRCAVRCGALLCPALPRPALLCSALLYRLFRSHAHQWSARCSSHGPWISPVARNLRRSVWDRYSLSKLSTLQAKASPESSCSHYSILARLPTHLSLVLSHLTSASGVCVHWGRHSTGPVVWPLTEIPVTFTS